MKKRNSTADMLKGLAVLFMIQVHIMEQFAKPEIYESIIGKISLFFGGPPCAPVFMVVMGYFLASSQKSFSYFLKRGVVLFVGGILLNIARSANLLHYIWLGQCGAAPFFYIFGVDILLLSGISIILIGILQLVFKKNFSFYFILAGIIAAIGPFLPCFGTGIKLTAYINAFLWGNFDWSYFPLFPWLAYILLGFAVCIMADKYQLFSKFTSSHSLVFSIPIIIAAGFAVSYAVETAHNLDGICGYYHHGIIYFGWVVLFMAGYAMAVHLTEVNSGKLLLPRYIKWVGKNVTVFYVVQWIIIGNIAANIYRTQESLELIYWFAGITAMVSILTFGWEKLKWIIKK